MTAPSILSVGLVTGVGLDAPSSCAAIRVGITGFVETRFMFDGDWLLGCPVPLEEPWTGREKLLRMATSAIAECLGGVDPASARNLPVLLCLSEETRPGRVEGLDETFLKELRLRLGCDFHPDSEVVPLGRVAAARAVATARELFSRGHSHCVIAGVDSLLSGGTLQSYSEQRRLLTESNSDGFIPGEAAGAILLASASVNGSPLRCLGIGFGTEPASLGSDEPLRGDGLAHAILAALRDGGIGFDRLDYRICDANGEQYWFKEGTLAVARTLRPVKPEFDVWHLADCIGDVGAAAGPASLAVASVAHRKGYAPGPGVLCHFSSDAEHRAAVALGI